MHATPRFKSKLPQVETTIFAVMSRLAAECRAVNLAQGFPDFQPEPELFDQVHLAMREGRNQYPPMAGLPELRTAIADKVAALYGARYDAEDEVTVTAGATQAIFTAVAAFVGVGDEVIVFEPVYDSYGPAVDTVGGTVVRLPLSYPDFRVDWGLVRRAISTRTKMIIVNSPHNPTGCVFSDEDWRELATITDGTDIVVLSDEVYEHIVFSDGGHRSVARMPELAARSLIVSSFGKTYHVTGWKVGYVVAPAMLMKEFRKIHQFNVFAVNAPMQAGLAFYMQDASRHHGLAAFYRAKRDHFQALMADTAFDLLPCHSTYFQLARYARISDLPDVAFSEWLTREVGVAAIPVSAFYADGRDDRIVRFCFAKQEETLMSAVERLRRL